MQEVLRELQPLGSTFGHNKPYTTTFVNSGHVDAASPLRAAYAHIEPTTLGYLAASLRLLRIPQLVYSLGQTLGKRTIVQHLMGVYGINLAVIFGDTNTIMAARRLMDKVHNQRLPAQKQPDWLVEVLGRRETFSPASKSLRSAVTTILASGVARAHQESGVIVDGYAGTQYCNDLQATVGHALRVDLEAQTLRDLHNYAAPQDVPLMNREQLTTVGVLGLMETVLGANLAPGVPIAQFDWLIKCLMWPDDQREFGMEPSVTERERFEKWTRDYSDKTVAHNLRTAEQVPAESNSELSRLHFFTVANRQ